MTNGNQAYLGTGWSFPPAFTKGGGVALVGAKEDIEQSLQILLSTGLGERVLQPTYGCDLTELLFEPLSPTIASNIKELVRVAILYHEPRIRLEAVNLTTTDVEGEVRIEVVSTIISTNSRFSFVYPFYLKEAAEPAP